jgi:hypothetical protein
VRIPFRHLHTFVLDTLLSISLILSTSHALFSPILNLVPYFIAVLTWSRKTRAFNKLILEQGASYLLSDVAD